MWTGLVGPVIGFCKNSNDPSYSIKAENFLNNWAMCTNYEEIPYNAELVNLYCLDLVPHLQRQALQYQASQCLNLCFTLGDTHRWPIQAVSQMCDWCTHYVNINICHLWVPPYYWPVLYMRETPFVASVEITWYAFF